MQFDELRYLFFSEKLRIFKLDASTTDSFWYLGTWGLWSKFHSLQLLEFNFHSHMQEISLKSIQKLSQDSAYSVLHGIYSTWVRQLKIGPRYSVDLNRKTLKEACWMSHSSTFAHLSKCTKHLKHKGLLNQCQRYAFLGMSILSLSRMDI